MTMTAWCMQKLFLDFLPGKVCASQGVVDVLARVLLKSMQALASL